MPILKWFGKKKTVESLIASGRHREARDLLVERIERARPEAGDELPGLYKQVAGLCERLGENQAALDHYGLCADFYSAKGFYEKAVATYKKALRLDPENPKLLEQIAAFNRKVPKYMVSTYTAEEMQEKAKAIRLAAEAHARESEPEP